MMTLTLADRLRQYREARGYRRTDMGMLLRITGDHVGGLENGTWPSPPSRDLQSRLAAVLGCSVADLGYHKRVRRRTSTP
jgi:transcriptional regulator with XRE-family HTH domain